MATSIQLLRRGLTTVKYVHAYTVVLQKIRVSTTHSLPTVIWPLRRYSQQHRDKDSKALAESKSSSEVSTATAFETVKETTKTAGNLGVILFGLGITGSILWAIFRELFSGNSPNNIYSNALERCLSDQKIQDHLGEPIKGYGEENRRGRRRHVSHSIYIVDGKKHMLMKFYIQGSRKRGTVYVELKEDDRGDFQRSLLAVELEDLLRTKIIVEDNRQVTSSQSDMLPAFA